ncbi:MAG: serine/threonine protein kinase, partial [Deltaproteobacteria bacterium]|nr:serine/threonine protein kinase [Deltaproteobacteria bacterium]
MADQGEVDPLDHTSEGASPAASSRGDARLAAGARIGRYQLRDVLGEGGMGIVWSAHDPDLDRTIALKVIKRGDAPPQLRLRLLREARAMARLKHPNVLTVYEVGTEGDRDYIAMELVDGGPLEDWLRTNPGDREIVEALLDAGRGLAAAHQAGLVHRDFKPHNVLRRAADARVLLTDFGLARGTGDAGDAGDAAPPTVPGRGPVRAGGSRLDGSHDSVLDTALTQTGMLIGTPAYMAPEQFAGQEPDPRTDQFAFCVTAWQALTGARPFGGSTIDELRRAACAGVGEVQAALPPAVRAILARGLDPDPDRRWPDLDQLLEALEQVTRPARPRWWLPAAG